MRSGSSWSLKSLNWDLPVKIFADIIRNGRSHLFLRSFDFNRLLSWLSLRFSTCTERITCCRCLRLLLVRLNFLLNRLDFLLYLDTVFYILPTKDCFITASSANQIFLTILITTKTDISDVRTVTCEFTKWSPIDRIWVSKKLYFRKIIASGHNSVILRSFNCIYI